jgi:putative membrane protein
MAVRERESEWADRPLNYAILSELLLLGGTAALFFATWLRGNLDFYIHPRYTWLVLLSALVLLLMAAARARLLFNPATGSQSIWVLLLLGLPLLLGTLVPARPLGAGTLAGRALNAPGAVAGAWQPPNAGDSRSWTLLDWSFAQLTMPDAIAGKPADVVGFVYQQADFGPDMFYTARYVVTCCAADGAAVGLPVVWAGGGTLLPDTWVRVQGVIGSAGIAGVEQPAILADSVEPIPQPESPYLYP